MKESNHIPQFLKDAYTGVTLCVSEFESADQIAFQQGVQIEMDKGNHDSNEHVLYDEETVKLVRRTLTECALEKLPRSRTDSHKDVLDALLRGKSSFIPKSPIHQRIRDEFESALTVARLHLERNKIQEMFRYRGSFPQERLKRQLEYYFDLEDKTDIDIHIASSQDMNMFESTLVQSSQKWRAHGSTFIQLCSFAQNGGILDDIFSLKKIDDENVTTFLQKLALPTESRDIKQKLFTVSNLMHRTTEMLSRATPRFFKTLQTIKRQSDEDHNYPNENSMSYYTIGAQFMLHMHKMNTLNLENTSPSVERELFGELTDHDAIRYFDYLTSQYLVDQDKSNEETRSQLSHKVHEYHNPFGPEYGTIFLKQIQNYIHALDENDNASIERHYAHIPMLLQVARRYSMARFKEIMNAAGYSIDAIVRELPLYGRNTHEFARQKHEHFIQGMHDYFTFYNFKVAEHQRKSKKEINVYKYSGH